MKKYRNYIFLALIFIISIILCIYALEWHSVYKEEKLNTTIATDYLHELKKAEFMNYIGDNPFAVIYFGVTNSDECRRFEKQFKNYVIENNLTETIVYINVNEIVGPDFDEKLDKLYNKREFREQKKYFNEVPAIAVYNHTNLVDFISDTNLKIGDVDKLLEKYNLSGE